MQDLLKKIIEMDEQARKIEQEAKLEKIKSEEEVEQLRVKMYNEYIEKAKDRVEKNIAVEQAHAKERLEAYEAQIESAKSEMRRIYDEKKEKWVGEIVKRALA